MICGAMAQPLPENEALRLQKAFHGLVKLHCDGNNPTAGVATTKPPASGDGRVHLHLGDRRYMFDESIRRFDNKYCKVTVCVLAWLPHT